MRKITWGRVDHSRPARLDTAEPSQGWERSPALVVVAAAVLALVVCVINFALGNAHAGVTAAIVGMRSAKQVEGVIGALEFRLAPEEIRAIREAEHVSQPVFARYLSHRE